MKRQMIFATSDWHCHHPNSIKFDQRPFSDIDHMHRVLINNFNSTVPPDGITYFVGDMGFSGPGLKNIIGQLNGLKILVIGNHDKGLQAMYDMGFNLVVQGAKIIVAQEVVTISHYPLLGIKREPTDHIKGHEHENWHGETKHARLAYKDEGQFHLHGHIHAGPAHPGKKVIQDRQWDIGCVGNGYRPVSLSQIEGWIMRHKNEKA